MNKKKLFIIIISVVLVALGLRLFNLNKDEGMWNDEYLTWEIAKAAFPKEFFDAIIRNCHAPLHYIYLKIWMYFFGESDYVLRLSSVVPGVLSVICMFFCGRISGKKPSDVSGIAAAIFCAVSAFLIYFSQEVRIYSLLFLLSSINVFCALKTIDNPSKKNCILFILTSILVMIEHTIGFVFVFFSSIGVILFANKKTKFKKFFITAFLVSLLLLIPLAVFLYNTMFNQNYFSQWWAPFSWAKLAYFFTDLFSPCIVNITNAPPSFWADIYNNGNIKFGFILFAFIPLFIASICMLRAVFDFNNKVKYYLLTSIGVYLTVFFASLAGKIIFLTKYMMEIYPVLILLAVFGFSLFKDKGFKIILATVFVSLSMFYIAASNYSPVKLIREEGQNIPVVMLKILNAKNTDKILFLYYPKERYSKYNPEIPLNTNVSSVSKYDFTIIKDANKVSDIYGKEKAIYRSVFLSDKNQGLDNFLQENIYSKVKLGDKFFLVDFSPVSFFTKSEIESIVSNNSSYEKTPFLYLVFSYIKNYVLDESKTLLSYSGETSAFSWRIYVFEKT